MRNIFVPVLLLATVALSSSNILPILTMRQKPEVRGYGQSNDNIISNKHQTRDDMSDLLFKIDIENQKPLDTHKLYQEEYLNTDNNAAEEYNAVKDDNYDVKGFRKEQWHNYPRQLDRLNKYLYEHFNSDKRNLDPDDPGEYSDMEQIPESPNDFSSNEIHLYDSSDSQKPINDADKAAAIMNPLIVLKIHLDYLNKDVDFGGFSDKTLGLEDSKLIRNENEDYNINDENPRLNLVKVKREGTTRLEIADTAQHEPKNRTVRKRIFSLWSRLQSLNHKGHELQHRRHLYALYDLPDSEGGGSGGVLTAETRATFMRPPGSPLRWG
ncbi:Uncharacterized protein OBRU01_00483 [Operophtera brumata]|uniref:Uncharacterized protein n=1 Tax=Operophtera brumata TaxID=104452 RepID=A0A0L7LV48_OPEBR|nr:Uncharacterized protein OBRU01_00483 [Operophtera brumata]